MPIYFYSLKTYLTKKTSYDNPWLWFIIVLFRMHMYYLQFITVAYKQANAQCIELLGLSLLKFAYDNFSSIRDEQHSSKIQESRHCLWEKTTLIRALTMCNLYALFVWFMHVFLWRGCLSVVDVYTSYPRIVTNNQTCCKYQLSIDVFIVRI